LDLDRTPELKQTKTAKTLATTQSATAPDPVSAKNDGQRRGWSSPRRNLTADLRVEFPHKPLDDDDDDDEDKKSQIPLTKKFVDPDIDCHACSHISLSDWSNPFCAISSPYGSSFRKKNEESWPL
jgi:hypothetical protein